MLQPASLHDRQSETFTNVSESVVSMCVKYDIPAFTEGSPRQQPKTHDVLCGRGKSSLNHVGNKWFRGIIASHLDHYLTASRLEKGLIVDNIVESVLSSGGKFLKQEINSGPWLEVGTKKARERVGHAFRDANALRTKKVCHHQKGRSNKTSSSTVQGATSIEPSFIEAVPLDLVCNEPLINDQLERILFCDTSVDFDLDEFFGTIAKRRKVIIPAEDSTGEVDSNYDDIFSSDDECDDYPFFKESIVPPLMVH